jgi:hypothetical protein
MSGASMPLGAAALLAHSPNAAATAAADVCAFGAWGPARAPRPAPPRAGRRSPDTGGARRSAAALPPRRAPAAPSQPARRPLPPPLSPPPAGALMAELLGPGGGGPGCAYAALASDCLAAAPALRPSMAVVLAALERLSAAALAPRTPAAGAPAPPRPGPAW